MATSCEQAERHYIIHSYMHFTSYCIGRFADREWGFTVGVYICHISES